MSNDTTPCAEAATASMAAKDANKTPFIVTVVLPARKIGFVSTDVADIKETEDRKCSGTNRPCKS